LTLAVIHGLVTVKYTRSSTYCDSYSVRLLEQHCRNCRDRNKVCEYVYAYIPFFQPNNGTSLLMIDHTINTSNRPADEPHGPASVNQGDVISAVYMCLLRRHDETRGERYRVLANYGTEFRFAGGCVPVPHVSSIRLTFLNPVHLVWNCELCGMYMRAHAPPPSHERNETVIVSINNEYGYKR
jgi:hypothetical protein